MKWPFPFANPSPHSHVSKTHFEVVIPISQSSPRILTSPHVLQSRSSNYVFQSRSPITFVLQLRSPVTFSSHVSQSHSPITSSHVLQSRLPIMFSNYVFQSRLPNHRRQRNAVFIGDVGRFDLFCPLSAPCRQQNAPFFCDTDHRLKDSPVPRSHVSQDSL